jgi:DNA repair protein RadA/Sms
MKLNVRDDSIGFGTNVLDIKVPDQLKNKIKSGVEYIDSALGGEGFTPSQVVLFTGTPGAGKTTMLLTLADKLTQAGNQVVFNTAEESLFQVRLIVDRLGLKSGFAVGQETHVPSLLKKCDTVRNKAPNKPFFLLVDSLQCMDDGHYDDGSINSRSPERSLQLITEWSKKYYTNSLVIGQVNKSGKMAGTQKLKHMVDAMMELSVEEKDEDFKGCRVLQTVKNRFGGCGATHFLSIHSTGFKLVAKVAAYGG